MQKQTIEKKSQVRVLKPMHRDRPTPVWENNDIKGSNSSKNRKFRGIRQEQNSLTTQKLKRKKSENSKKSNKKQYTLEFLAYLSSLQREGIFCCKQYYSKKWAISLTRSGTV